MNTDRELVRELMSIASSIYESAPEGVGVTLADLLEASQRVIDITKELEASINERNAA